VRAPGSAIGNGFVVAPGSHLLGAAFSQEAASTRTWVAVVLVTGEPERVMGSYVSQADKLGVALRPSCENQTQDVTCWASGTSGPVQVELYLRRRMVSPPFSHLTITYRQSSKDFEAGPPGAGAKAEAVALPRIWPPLPKVGQQFGVGYFSPVLDERGVRLVAGSELVAPPGPCPTGNSGFVAVLRVGGNQKKVMRRYGQQFQRSGFDGEVTRSRLSDGTRLLAVGSDESGAGYLYAQSEVGSPYMRIDRCGD
jgi:hypothetical protein